MKNRTCAVVPCVIAARLAVVVGLGAALISGTVAVLPGYAYAKSAIGGNNTQAGELPTVRETLSKEKAEQMEGCEAYFDQAKYEFVIRPKNGANEGIISANLKQDDFEKIHNILTNKDYSGATLRFEGKVHGYGSISGLFSDTRIESLGNIGVFDVSNVTDMSSMFRGCSNLSNISGLKDWNTSNVTNMNSMFKYCFCDELDYVQQSSTFLNPISNWDVSNVTDMGGMFYLGENLDNIIALESWNTSNVKNMSYMFSRCKKIKNLDGLKNWKTGNVIDMSHMFEDCKSLLNINGVANWNTGNVTNMQRMFANCLQSVNLCDNSKGNCLLTGLRVSSVPDLDAVKNWDVSKVSKMGGMFAGSHTLTDISALKNWQFNKDLPYIDLGYLVTGNRISEADYVDFLKSLIQNLKGFQGRLVLNGFGLEKLNESQINDIFGDRFDSIIIIYEKFDENINANSALLKLKTKKKVTLTFTGSKKQSIEINDLPAVYISSEFYDDDNDEEQNKNDFEAVKSVVNKAIESKIKELQKTHPELTGKYAPSKEIANINDIFQTYNLEVDHQVTNELQAENALTAMYRLYNPYTHEHFFTAETVENDNLVRLGWKSEGGVGYIYKHAEKGGVYRLYNPTTGEHHYTMNEDEVATCVKAGWKNEGVKWFSAQDKEVTLNKLYSMYNPYEKKFYHHYTADADEIAKMVKAGWRKEEVKWCTLPVSAVK